MEVRFRSSPLALGLICCFVLSATTPVQAEMLVGVVDPHSAAAFWGIKGARNSQLAYQPLDRPRLHPSALALLEKEEAIEGIAVWLAVLSMPPSWVYDYFNPPPAPPPPSGSLSPPASPPSSPPSSPPGCPATPPGTPPPPPPLQTPEPSTLLLGTVGAGLIGLIRWRRKRRPVEKAGFLVEVPASPWQPW